uniref:Uncharacterized protein n=1 Tax=Echeneis naucrates TaxID=173247 RepID=A0A665X777_ECHNA
MLSYLQVTVVILTKKLEEAKDRLIYCHCGFNFQLGHLHPVIENPEELL